jgi:hypothetical protein
MAPKPEPARLAFVFGVVATILAIMAWLPAVGALIAIQGQPRGFL